MKMATNSMCGGRWVVNSLACIMVLAVAYAVYYLFDVGTTSSEEGYSGGIAHTRFTDKDAFTASDYKGPFALGYKDNTATMSINYVAKIPSVDRPAKTFIVNDGDPKFPTGVDKIGAPLHRQMLSISPSDKSKSEVNMGDKSLMVMVWNFDAVMSRLVYTDDTDGKVLWEGTTSTFVTFNSGTPRMITSTMTLTVMRLEDDLVLRSHLSTEMSHEFKESAKQAIAVKDLRKGITVDIPIPDIDLSKPTAILISNSRDKVTLSVNENKPVTLFSNISEFGADAQEGVLDMNEFRAINLFSDKPPTKTTFLFNPNKESLGPSTSLLAFSVYNGLPDAEVPILAKTLSHITRGQ